MTRALTIEMMWTGEQAQKEEHARVVMIMERDALVIHIDAPFHGDPAPDHPPGPAPALWNHEVIEIFILGPNEHYTEVEIGPHGHHLVIQLEGRRSPVAQLLPLDLVVSRDAQRWRGQAVLGRCLLPPTPHRINAYAIHGARHHRRYLAAYPVPGDVPDFHRLDCFEPVTWPRSPGATDVTLEALRPTHLDAIFELTNHPLVLRYIPGEYPLERDAFMAKTRPRTANPAGPRHARCAILVGATVVGKIDLFERPIGDARRLEVGYVIGEQWWGQGIATQALTHFLSRIQALGARGQLSATHVKDNHASGRVLEKCGFIYKGEGPFELPSGEVVMDALWQRDLG